MKIQRSDLNNSIKDIDFFICSAGFEERSTIVAQTLNLSNIRYKAVFHIANSYKLSEINLNKICSAGKFDLVEYPKNEPVKTYDIIKDYLSNIETTQAIRVLIDVTTFTREVLLIILKIFNSDEMHKKYIIQFIYTPARAYQTSDDSEEQWLTKGVREIRSIFGFSGLHIPSKKLMLIILTGLEDERIEIIVESFEPNALLLGKPSLHSSSHPDLDVKANLTTERLKNKYSSFLNYFEFSCDNILETQKIIEELYLKYEDEYNITIAPLNNKISTLGVAMASLNKENIQVCYASANQYNIKYSKPNDYFIFCK